jgi:uncharacterized protein YoaH (UPF0181 family)
MTEPDDAESVANVNSERSLTQQQRAIETLKAINAGGDPSAEAFRLANDFTDRHAARLFAWFGRRKPRN